MTDTHPDELVADCSVAQATVLSACRDQTVMLRGRRGVIAFKDDVSLSEGARRTVTVDFRFANSPAATAECQQIIDQLAFDVPMR